jgi:hypothetical protein
MKTKSIRISRVIIFITLFTLVGCAAPTELPPQPSATIAPTITATSTEIPTPTATPSPTPTPLPLNGQQTQYYINATIDYYNSYVTAKSRSIYTNKTAQPIDQMVFIVYPTIFESAIYIKSVKNGSIVVDYDWESHRMVIPLDEPLLPGEQIEFTHDFELYMPDREGTFGQADGQLNLSYWFPFIPPRTDDSWQVNEISLANSRFIGEFLVLEVADYEVRIDFIDRRENLTIAAGAISKEENGEILYKSHLARTFTLSISDSFVMTEREFNGTKIQSYAFVGHADVGEATADVAEEALALYTEKYGPYTRDVLSIVEFNADIGMEFDGLIFLSFAFYNLYPGTPKSNIHVYTAHEIAHQWFFSQVGNDQALEPWLDEAFATFSEGLFYENVYPEYFSWWKQNYIDAHNPFGSIDISIYDSTDLSEYRTIVYRNGALFLYELRNTIGDQVFFEFLRNYINKFRYKIVTSKDFWETLSEYTDADLSSIQEKYFATPPTIP